MVRIQTQVTEIHSCFISSVCEHPAYRNIVLRSLPNLQILDGGFSCLIFLMFPIPGSLVGIVAASEDFEKHLLTLTPDTTDFEQSLSRLPPWIPPTFTQTQSVEPVTVDDMMLKYPNLKDMMESVTDMLNEDSNHLLRLSTQALSKAQVK
jgi:hypothetical protein